MTDQNITVGESSKVTIDVKTLVGILAMILSIAGVYFSLTGQVATLQLDVIRMQDAVASNSEFRVKWPRGELGALPDDAVQDLNIEYIQKELAKVQEELDGHLEGSHASLSVPNDAELAGLVDVTPDSAAAQ
jgi:hypothetical protein|tara:strand:+ start:257 stop:652 length:396 start_codon:yes stop_codon:yes gene_type:complete